MLFDSKGKLFGKISIVDIIVVLAIVIAAAGVYFKFFGSAKESMATDCTFYYTMKVEGIRDNNAEALKESIGSKLGVNEKSPANMGEIISVDITPAVGIIEKDDGTVVKADMLDKYDALITVKNNGKMTSTGYFTPELREVSAGANYSVYTKLCEVTGRVQKIWVE